MSGTVTLYVRVRHLWMLKALGWWGIPSLTLLGLRCLRLQTSVDQKRWTDNDWRAI